MATCMTVICLITTKETSDKGYFNGSAMYRSNKKNYKHFDFRLFNNLKNKDIHSFDEGDIVTLTGKFCFRNDFDGDNPLFVCIQFFFTFFKSTFIKIIFFLYLRYLLVKQSLIQDQRNLNGIVIICLLLIHM